MSDYRHFGTIITPLELSSVVSEYRCPNGHSLRLHANEYVQMVVQTETEQYKYNFCPLCFGEWAVKQWPLTKVEV